jgi:hypothetical protein
MKKLFYGFYWFMLCTSLANAVHINEIMYNPVGDDNNKEFVEVIGTDNLLGYVIGDIATNDSLALLKFMPGNFSLIVEEGFNYSETNCSIYSAGPTIGNNLNNDADTVFLYYNQELVDSISYNASLANNNGYSLELINGSWKESCETGGSPGRENCLITNITNNITNETINETSNQTRNASVNNTQNISENNTQTNTTEVNTTETNSSADNTSEIVKIEILLPETLLLGVVYDSLFKITNLNRTEGENYVFVLVHYNITKNNSLIMSDYFNKTINYYASSSTGRLFFEEEGNYTLCWAVVNTTLSACKELAVVNPLSISCFIEINISTDKELYLEDEKIRIENSISNESFPFIIEYWIEDLFGNEVKEKYNTSNTNTKTFTPDMDENDKVFLVKNKLVFVGCDNKNTELEKEKLIVVKREEPIFEDDEDNKKAESQNTTTCAETARLEATKETGKIYSFYTLSKNFNEKINLYANIKGNGTYDLVLLSNKGEQKQSIIAPKKINFSIEPEPGLNLFALLLRKDNKTIDTNALLAKLESKAEENNTTIKEEKAVVKRGKQANNETNTTIKLTNQAANNSLSQASGEVVYESPNAKAIKFAPYFLILLAVLVIVGLVLSKRR